jgi:hypothetical protein
MELICPTLLVYGPLTLICFLCYGVVNNLKKLKFSEQSKKKLKKLAPNFTKFECYGADFS